MITDLYKKKLRKDVFRLSILTLIMAVIWIGLVTYRALSKNQLNPVVKEQITPLTPSLDIDTIDEIKQRQQIPTVDWNSLKPLETKFLLETETSSSPSAQTELEASPSGEQSD